MVFYFKINTCSPYMLRNLRHWLSAMEAYGGGEAYLLCDREDVKAAVEAEFPAPLPWLSSRSDPELRRITGAVCEERWTACGDAHLSTFFHAREQGFDSFWNIDADDTRMCVSPEKIARILREAEAAARREDLALFSLDMWYTQTLGRHWTFGVTFVRDPAACIRAFSAHAADPAYFRMVEERRLFRNVDAYATCLRDMVRALRAETFYVENLLFVHYAEDLLYKSVGSGVMQWSRGVQLLPLMYCLFGLRNQALHFIRREEFRIDIGLDVREGTVFLREASYPLQPLIPRKDAVTFWDFFDTSRLSIHDYKHRHGIHRDDPVVFFGLGPHFRCHYLSLTEEFHNILGYSDNDPRLWRDAMPGGREVLPPEELKDLPEKSKTLVILCMSEPADARQAGEPLKQMGFDRIVWLGEMLGEETL